MLLAGLWRNLCFVLPFSIMWGCDQRNTMPDSGGEGLDASPDAPTAHLCADDPFDPEVMRQRVTYLASDELGGRGTGSPGLRLARDWVREHFVCIGLLPGAPGGGFEQVFTDSQGNEAANIIGYVPGTDPTVGSEILVVGAHYDHLGRRGNVIYPGANDNASGVAGLLALAQAVQSGPAPRRTVAFVAFGVEEDPVGLEGSYHFVETSAEPLPLGRVVYMVNFDMIGSYHLEGRAYALGSFVGSPGRLLLESLAPSHSQLRVDLGEPGDSSDHEAFCAMRIPYLFFWTADDACYHESCDRADRIDYAHMSGVAGVAAAAVSGLADTTTDLAAFRRDLRYGCPGP